MSISSTSHLAENRFAELGIVLPACPKPVANYVLFTISENLLFISGPGPRTSDQKFLTGKVGQDITPEEAAVGVNSLPENVSVEIAAILEIS
jgi:enamine deaminase RidA (YjgF/YER057c/UK114 family)